MSLGDHAFRELSRAGFFDKDSDYEGNLGHAVMELIDIFSDQGHSGYSAQAVIALFTKLAKWEPLSLITSDPEEWNDVSEMSGQPMWQNKRDSRCFSHDGGKTWYSLEDKKK
jgi:hypothetical protein